MATNSYIPKTSETNISKRVNNKKKSSSYIPKTSETNVSTGTSSQSTPTSSQEATRLNQLRSITSSSSGGRNGSTSSSSVSSSTQSSNQESLREQYIEGSKNNNIKPPVSEQSQKISLSPSSSTTQRIARQ